MSPADRPASELAQRARAAANRLLRKDALAERRAVHDRCVGLDTRALLATPVAEARFVVLDLETTGFAAYAGDEIVQAALLEYRGLEPTGEALCSLVRPSIPIPATATAVHGIDDEIVADAPTIEAIIDDIVEFLDGAVIVGHHAAFDLRFLNRVTQRELFCRLPHPTVDPCCSTFHAAAGWATMISKRSPGPAGCRPRGATMPAATRRSRAGSSPASPHRPPTPDAASAS
ncbi:MAG: 3'-5' exonuclease [Halofilum sp. (in: g-proteobacteria)]|nr:3'-5' exonuclease [Halofilum sp. (in: g-proteobacteria)]